MLEQLTRQDIEAAIEEATTHGYVKFNMCHEDGDVEGLWGALCSPKAAEVYQKSTFGDTIEVFLLNHPVFVSGPTPLWGLLLKCKTQGDARPTIAVKDVIKAAKAQEDYLRRLHEVPKASRKKPKAKAKPKPKTKPKR